MRIRVILNAQSGAASSGATATPDNVRSAFRAAGLAPDILALPPAELDAHFARAATDAGLDVLVVGGGDGTLSAAAAHLAGRRTALGILPLGTLNHFAHDLGIPTTLAEAVGVIAAAQTRLVDVAEVNGHVFLNNCSLGAYPAAVRRRDTLRRSHGFGKWRAMALASLDVLRRLRRLHATLEVDGTRRSARTALLLVSNNRYSGRFFSSALREHLDTGQLWLYVARTHRFLPLVRSAWQALTRGLDCAEALDATPARQLTVDVRLPQVTVGLDGELATFAAPLRFCVRPRALRVLVPPT